MAANENATQITDVLERYKYLYLIEECWKKTHNLKKASELIGIGLQVVKNYKPLGDACNQIADWYAWGPMLLYHLGNIVREDNFVGLSQEKLTRFAKENKENVSNLRDIMEAATASGKKKLEEFSKNL